MRWSFVTLVMFLFFIWVPVMGVCSTYENSSSCIHCYIYIYNSLTNLKNKVVLPNFTYPKTTTIFTDPWDLKISKCPLPQRSLQPTRQHQLPDLGDGASSLWFRPLPLSFPAEPQTAWSRHPCCVLSEFLAHRNHNIKNDYCCFKPLDF